MYLKTCFSLALAVHDPAVLEEVLQPLWVKINQYGPCYVPTQNTISHMLITTKFHWRCFQSSKVVDLELYWLHLIYCQWKFLHMEIFSLLQNK